MLDVEALVPAGPLGEFLDSVGAAGAGETPAVDKIGEGRSNLTFRVSRGGSSWVLRRPPMGDLPETAHDMSASTGCWTPWPTPPSAPPGHSQPVRTPR